MPIWDDDGNFINLDSITFLTILLFVLTLLLALIAIYKSIWR